MVINKEVEMSRSHNRQYVLSRGIMLDQYHAEDNTQSCRDASLTQFTHSLVKRVPDSADV